MKRKDFLLIGMVIVISIVFALVLSSLLIGSPQSHQQEAEVVQAITDTFPPPDKKYFNDQSVNPTKVITIGDNANPAPFTGNKQ